ncbi:MAG: PrsW family intramembrane metalloprotease [Anaerolineae bacterium]|nr:PrsW family intramembrane metalloprotease [Anaerolineae bacterium]
MTTTTLIAYLIAIAIPAFTVYVFVMLDVFGTGKPSTILLCVGWGATGAFLLAYVINTAILDQGIQFDTLTRIAAPIIEEILKALILIYLINHPRFRYIVDGAVYGIAAGIGFALSENLFIYIPDAGEAALGAAISRTLSTAMMHAAASGMVGISLGRLRRAQSRLNFWPMAGIILAIALHVIYNNVAQELEGGTLLLVAIGIGMGSGILIAVQIGQGLADEKRRFETALTEKVGVAEAERQAVQRLGSGSMEEIFEELGDFFGEENVTLIRRQLVIQANIGILQNNLNSPASDRLRDAWQAEIDELRGEFEEIRKKLGRAVMLFMKSVFPSTDETMQEALNEELGKFDPTLVHTFDMFMRVSELAGDFTPEQLVAMAERLNKMDIFKNVSLANLENLSRAIRIETFADGHMIFDEGDEGNAMYMVENGEIDIYVTGHEAKLRTFEAGSVVGEFSLLDGDKRSARAVASGSTKVLSLERQVFNMFIQSRPDVVLAMLQYLAEKGRYTTNSVETSVESMNKIAVGDYAAVTVEREDMVAEPVATTDEVFISLDPEEVSADTARKVSGVFKMAATKLQQRETELAKAS